MARILVAEDDRDLRKLLAGILDDAGYEVAEAANGAEALEQIEITEPDLLLLDLMMPVMDGFEVMESLKGIPAAEGMPIIILSAVPPRKGEAKAWKLGARHYIPKPFNPTRVELSIKVALRDAVEEKEKEKAGRSGADQVFRPGSVDLLGDYDVGESVIKTGHEYLDLMLNGGIHIPSLILVEGDVSTGKGVLSQHLSYEALQAGHGVTYFTSDHSPQSIIDQMESLGMPVAEHIDNALLHVLRLQQPVFGDRCEWAVSPERLMITLIEDLQSNAELRKVVVLDDISDMMRYGEESNVLQMFTECIRLRDEGSTIVAIAQSYAIDQQRRNAIHELCDTHFGLGTTALGEKKGTLLTVYKANGKELESRNTVAFRIMPDSGIRAVDMPMIAATG